MTGQAETTMNAVYVRFLCAMLLAVTATIATAARAAETGSVQVDKAPVYAAPQAGATSIGSRQAA